MMELEPQKELMIADAMIRITGSAVMAALLVGAVLAVLLVRNAPQPEAFGPPDMRGEAPSDFKVPEYP